MTPDSHIVFLSIALVGALLLSGYLGWLANRCRCDSCAFHKHERLVAIAEAKLKADAVKAKQADLRHEYEHKGGGYKDSDPDKFDCPSGDCRRNKQSQL